MPITVTCNNCQKRYKVDAKLGGKKAHCKNCGASFTIPKLEVPEAADPSEDLLAGLTAATGTVQPAAATAKVASGGTKPRTTAKPLPKATQAPKASKAPPPVPEAPSGEMDFAEPPCPGCGKSLPPAHQICLSCGYNRATKQKMQVAGQAAPAASASGKGPAAKGPTAMVRGLKRNLEQPDSDHDYRGVRINKAYENTFLNLLDTWIPRLVIYLILLCNLLYFGLLWYGALSAKGAAGIGLALLATVILVAYEAIVVFTTLAMTNLGIGLGAKIMKTGLPEDYRYGRILATSLLPSFLFFVVLVIMGVGVAIVSRGGIPGTGSIAATLVALGVALLVFLGSSFFTFLFFFRLKALESLVAYLFYVMFFILGVMLSGGIVVALVIVLAKVIGASAKVLA